MCSESVHLGCFPTATQAAAAWDMEARRRGWRLVNSPQPGEMDILHGIASAAELVNRFGFPRPPTNRTWRLKIQAVRSVLERRSDSSMPIGADGASYTIEYAAALRDEAVCLSGAWILNFQPLCAAALYRKFGPASGCVVFDPCGGWGGRLLGAAAAGNVSSYTACEPSAATHDGLCTLSSLVRERVPSLRCHLLKRGAEETTLPPGTVDIVLTSPPYFNLEMYTSQGEAVGEPSQSHIRYPDPSTWASQFLGVLIRNASGPYGSMLE